MRKPCLCGSALIAACMDDLRALAEWKKIRFQSVVTDDRAWDLACKVQDLAEYLLEKLDAGET
jgi:hypothetical protein